MSDFVDPFESDESTEGGEAVGNTAVSGSALELGEEKDEGEASNTFRAEGWYAKPPQERAANHENTFHSPSRPEQASPPSVGIIKTPEDVPAALDRIVADRRNVDLDWLKRRAGKKK